MRLAGTRSWEYQRGSSSRQFLAEREGGVVRDKMFGASGPIRALLQALHQNSWMTPAMTRGAIVIIGD
jgi:hypothetical protein